MRGQHVDIMVTFALKLYKPYVKTEKRKKIVVTRATQGTLWCDKTSITFLQEIENRFGGISIYSKPL